MSGLASFATPVHIQRKCTTDLVVPPRGGKMIPHEGGRPHARTIGLSPEQFHSARGIFIRMRKPMKNLVFEPLPMDRLVTSREESPTQWIWKGMLARGNITL